MQKQRFSYAVLCILAPFSCLAGELRVSVRAEAAILINADSGEVLYSKHPDTVAFPASITKIATALFVLDMYGDRMEEIVTITQEAISRCSLSAKRVDPVRYPPYRLEPGATTMDLQLGEKVSVQVLLSCMLIRSANDASNAIAIHFCGSVDRFMEELNIYLRRKGFLHSHFVNPHGLHAPSHVTTARDMAGIAQAAMRFPIFRNMVVAPSFVRPLTNCHAETIYLQSNRLLKKGKYFCPQAIGIKTGYTSHAGFTLVAAANTPERTVIAVLLGCKEMEHRYRDALALFHAVAAEKKIVRTLFTSAHDTFSVAVRGGTGPLTAKMAQDLLVEYFPSEEPPWQAEVAWEFARFPICAGARVGKVCLIDPRRRRILQEVPVFAVHTVARSARGWLSEVFRSVWQSPKTLPILVSMGCVTVFAYIACRRVGKAESDMQANEVSK